MKHLFYCILILLCFSSCIELQDVEFKGMDGIKIEKMENKKIALSLGVKIENPNFFSIKIKPSVVDVFVNDELIGKAYLDEKIKLIHKTENTYFTKIHVDLEEGSIFKFMKYAMKLKVQLRVKGKIKGSVYGISKKVEIDEMKEVDGSNFKMDKLFNFND
jgi:LEA14-like dessication related protein